MLIDSTTIYWLYFYLQLYDRFDYKLEWIIYTLGSFFLFMPWDGVSDNIAVIVLLLLFMFCVKKCHVSRQSMVDNKLDQFTE